VLTNDIDPTADAMNYADAADPKTWDSLPRAHYVITNPPFNVAAKILEHAYEAATVGVAMLLRGSFTEPTFDRQDWLDEHTAYLSDIIFLPRISFTADGRSDSVSANWYVWRKHKVEGCRLHWVRKQPRARALSGDNKVATAQVVSA
jgi:hypothetical protein